MIYTQDVTAWAEVSGLSNFRLTEVNVERKTGRQIGRATIKGLPPADEELVEDELGANVKIYVATESATNPWEKDLNTQKQIFFGQTMKATQDRNGLVTLEVYGQRDILHNKLVKLEVENESYTHRVLRDLLEDTFGTIHENYEDATPFQPYLASADDFAMNPQRPWRFGNANKGYPLINAIEELLKSLGGVIWTDRFGVVRVEPYPSDTTWRTPLITSISAGESSRNAKRVIFSSSGLASELGQGASYINSQTSHETESLINDDDDDGPDPPDKTIGDDNVSTYEEADHQAYNEAVKEDQNRDLGEATIIGNGAIDVYDHIRIPDIEYNNQSSESIPNDYQAGRYKVDGIIHKISASNGFLTTIELSPAWDGSLLGCTAASGSGFKQERLRQYENSRTKEQVSLDDNGEAGPIVRLFGGI